MSAPSRRPALPDLEGIEGVGKTTQRGRAVEQPWSARGVAHVVTREPGGTPLAESIRHLVLDARGQRACRRPPSCC